MSRGVPWVGDDAGRREEERRVAAIVGRRIVAVRYFERPDAALFEAEWWRGQGYDLPGPGLELDFDDGRTWAFTWHQSADHEGLLAGEGRLTPRDHTACDVTERSGWPGVVGRPIEAVEGAWVRDSYEDGSQSALMVLSWLLRHSGDQHVVITLGEHDENGAYRYMADSVAVFFSIADARRHGVPLPDDPIMRSQRFEDLGIGPGGSDYIGWDHELEIEGRVYRLRQYEDESAVHFMSNGPTGDDRIRGGVPYDDPVFTRAARWVLRLAHVEQLTVFTSDPEYPDDSYAPVDLSRL